MLCFSLETELQESSSQSSSGQKQGRPSGEGEIRQAA
jgi:hypothetical protein